MRLLAYGGTAYVERQRIGTWENAPRDALDDSFRLEEERLTFGLCLIEKDPLLVIRRLQITKTGRAYAYSLLLDPGLDIWRKFEWDAAALAEVLFNEGPEAEVSKLLLEQPEKLNAQDLQDIFDSVSRKADQSVKKQPDEVNDYEAAWIGGFFTPSASSLPPQVLGFPTRPNFAETSALIRRLPVCFRAGMGWLIGSSSQSARSFGARFSIDERADLDSGTPLVDRGRRLYQALQTLAGDDEFAETVSQLATNPAWEWFAGATENSAILADRLILVADLLRPLPDEDELLDKAIAALPQTEFFQDQLRRAWQRAVMSSQKKLTDTQTLFALENYFDHSLPLPNDYLPFLDPQKLAERFVSEGLLPSHQSVPQLSLSLRRKVWGLHLQHSQNEDLPGIFFEAIDDLEEMGGDEAVAHVTELTQEVGERMANDGSLNLLFWNEHTQHRHWVNIRKLLCNLSMQRARLGNTGWQLEYLLFADDDGGEKLAQANIPESQLRNMIRSFVTVMQEQKPYVAEAKRWLEALADSSIRLRGVLTCEDKYWISQIVHSHKWINYIDLYDLYVNHTPISNPPCATDDQRTILVKELEELIRQKPAGDFVPDLRGLQIMLGPLPKSIMRFFQELSPKISSAADADKWLQGLGSIDPARASKEEVRVLLEGESDISTSRWLNPDFEEKQLSLLLWTLMFRSYPTRGELYRRRFRYVMTQALDCDAQHVLNAVCSIFKEGIKPPAQANVFCERFGKDRDSLDMLFQVLPKSSSGLALTDALYKVAAGHFVKEAQNAWLAAWKNKTSTFYERALLYHLSKRRDARIQVERELEDQMPGKQIKLRLDEILKSDPGPGTLETQTDKDVPVIRTPETTQPPDDERVVGDEEETESIGQRIKRFIGIGSAQKESKGSDGRRGEIFEGLGSAKRSSRRQNASEDGD